ncbi:MAG: hypothetical protein JXB62_00465 [Pirellulales bacterium]|nr:hypothetical protein [Pirellulales bacterium]
MVHSGLRMRIVTAALLAVGLFVVAAGRLSAAEGPPGPKGDEAPPPSTPPQAREDELRPLGPPPGRGPAQSAGGRPFSMRQGNTPNAAATGPPGRGALGGRRGPPEDRGPYGRGRLGGLPRWPHRSWDDLQNNDPRMYELLTADSDLDRQARELAIQYRRAPQSQRPNIKEELEAVVEKHFDVRQQRRALELKRLEEELKRLRDAFNDRNKARNDLVGQRVSQLLQEDVVEF